MLLLKVQASSTLSSGTQMQPPKSERKPLQPKNSVINNHVKPKLQQNHEWTRISLPNDSNKENHPIYATPKKLESFNSEPFDASLAEELSAIREKLERLRIEKDNTEKLLRKRDSVLDLQMKELEKRGDAQKQLEIEVDRLYRLKELRPSCMIISSIRSLREKEQKRKIKEVHSQDTETKDI